MLTGWAARVGPVDPPRERSAHQRPTPTSGGLAILAGAGAGAAALGVLGAHVQGGASGRQAALALALAGGLGLMGSADDLLDLGARAKLLVQASLALLFALFVTRVETLPILPGLAPALGVWVGAFGTALWVVTAVNAVNFMDGANGVAAPALGFVLAALGVQALRGGESVLGVLALCGAAANLGYAPWNLGGRLFQGDAGSLFSGALAATLAIVAAGRSGQGAAGAFFVPTALLPLLTDVLLTLLWRARRGESLLEAHRDHLYQLWLRRTGHPHSALAGRVALIMAAACGFALCAQAAPAGWQAPLFGVALAANVAGWVGWRARLERPVKPAG